MKDAYLWGKDGEPPRKVNIQDVEIPTGSAVVRRLMAAVDVAQKRKRLGKIKGRTWKR